MPMPAPANRLKELRKDRGVHVTQLAASVGRDSSTYGRYERGEVRIPLEVVRELARFYDVTVEYLLGWDGPPAEEASAA